jgi:hypothetical protein
MEELDDVATVDGHDFGSGRFNIFVLTDDPATAFGRAHGIVINQGVPNVMRSAYREGWRGLRDSLAFIAHRT